MAAAPRAGSRNVRLLSNFHVSHYPTVVDWTPAYAADAGDVSSIWRPGGLITRQATGPGDQPGRPRRVHCCSPQVRPVKARV